MKKATLAAKEAAMIEMQSDTPAHGVKPAGAAAASAKRKIRAKVTTPLAIGMQQKNVIRGSGTKAAVYKCAEAGDKTFDACVAEKTGDDDAVVQPACNFRCPDAEVENRLV